MLVSVVILIHDESINHIDKCVKSIVSQTYSNFEIVIVDDSNKKINENYFLNLKKNKININYFKYNKKINLPEARNIGISKSSGKYIFLQDSDDWSEPNRIEDQLLYLKNGIDICCGLTNYYNSTEQFIFNVKQKLELKKIEYTNIIKNNHVAIGSVAFRKDIFKGDINIFKSEIKFCDDMDFVLRNSKKFNFVQINKLIYNYRFNKNSSTLNTNDNLQPYLDFLVLQEMYRSNNFDIDNVRNGIINTNKNYVFDKNNKQRISYMAYSGNYLSALKNSKGIKLKIYCFLITLKVLMLLFKNKKNEN